MSINTKQIYKLSVKRATRTRRRQQQQQQRRRRTNSPSIGSSSSNSNKVSRNSFKTMVQVECKSKLSQKLQALKNLIPTHNGDMEKPDQLFKETADYIVLLRTRVLVLQKLIELYGDNTEDENAMLL